MVFIRSICLIKKHKFLPSGFSRRFECLVQFRVPGPELEDGVMGLRRPEMKCIIQYVPVYVDAK